MILKIWFLTWLLVLTWFAAAYTQELYPLPDGDSLLGELKTDCYGPAVSCDGTGRAFYWQDRSDGAEQGPNVVIEPRPNFYGFGSSADQFGRHIEPSVEAQDQRTPPSMRFHRRDRLDR